MPVVTRLSSNSNSHSREDRIFKHFTVKIHDVANNDRHELKVCNYELFYGLRMLHTVCFIMKLSFSTQESKK